jgi:hypothetical protein
MYQRTHSSMMSASNMRLWYIGSRAIGFVIQHLGQTKSGSLSDVPGCTRTRDAQVGKNFIEVSGDGLTPGDNDRGCQGNIAAQSVEFSILFDHALGLRDVPMQQGMDRIGELYVGKLTHGLDVRGQRGKVPDQRL